MAFILSGGRVTDSAGHRGGDALYRSEELADKVRHLVFSVACDRSSASDQFETRAHGSECSNIKGADYASVSGGDVCVCRMGCAGLLRPAARGCGDSGSAQIAPGVRKT